MIHNKILDKPAPKLEDGDWYVEVPATIFTDKKVIPLKGDNKVVSKTRMIFNVSILILAFTAIGMLLWHFPPAIFSEPQGF